MIVYFSGSQVIQQGGTWQCLVLIADGGGGGHGTSAASTDL